VIMYARQAEPPHASASATSSSPRSARR
jgi:hypothetical protein